MQLVRTTAANKDFIHLVSLLNKELEEIYKEQQSFFVPFNKIETIRHVVLAYHNEIPVGCGALRPFDQKTAEIKRMYVDTAFRGQGIASKILQELESMAKEMNYTSCVLETGNKQLEAIKLYNKSNYVVIPNFEPYENMDISICMKKIL